MGSRKDFYEANRDIKQVALRRVREGLTKRLDRAEEQLVSLQKNGNGSSVSQKRIQELQSLIAKASKAMVFISQWIA